MNVSLRRRLARARERDAPAHAELVEIALSIARGQVMKVQGRRRGRTPTISERLEAVMFLTDLLRDLEASGPNTARNTVE